jgi:hypothetical protein
LSSTNQSTKELLLTLDRVRGCAFARLRTPIIIATAVLGGLLTPSLSAASTISTVGSFTGSAICCFGDPNTATYGQTITVPAGETSLQSFTFYLHLPTSLKFRAFVYAWDGEKATGPALYESADLQTTEFAEGLYQPITASTGGVAVTPGQQYVLFFSTSNDKAADEGTELEGSWAWVTGTPYAGGIATWLNNGYEPTLWTNPTEEWSRPEASMEFSAVFGRSPIVTSVSPSSSSPGAEVKIKGENLGGATKVMFGSTPATSFTVISETEISAVIPPGVSGTMYVTIVTPAGASAPSAGDLVTVTTPSLTGPAPPAPIAAPVPHKIARCVVPFMRAFHKGAVKRALLAAGCTLGKIAHHYNRIHRGGLVEQNLHQTTEGPLGTEVGVWFSLGGHKRNHQRKHHRRS